MHTYMYIMHPLLVSFFQLEGTLAKETPEAMLHQSNCLSVPWNWQFIASCIENPLAV